MAKNDILAVRNLIVKFLPKAWGRVPMRSKFWQWTVWNRMSCIMTVQSRCFLSTFTDHSYLWFSKWESRPAEPPENFNGVKPLLHSASEITIFLTNIYESLSLIFISTFFEFSQSKKCVSHFQIEEPGLHGSASAGQCIFEMVFWIMIVCAFDTMASIFATDRTFVGVGKLIFSNSLSFIFGLSCQWS